MIKDKIRKETLSRMRKEELQYGVIGAEIRGRRMKLSRTLASIVKEVCSISYLCKIEKNCIRPNKLVFNELCKRLELDEKATKSLLDIKNTLNKTVKAFKDNDLATLEILSDEVKIFSNYRSVLIMYIYCIYTNKFEKANLIDKDLLNVISGMNKDDLKIYFTFHAILEFYNQSFKDASTDFNEILSSYELDDDLKVIVYRYKLFSELKLNSYRIVSTYDEVYSLYLRLCEYKKLEEANYVLAFYYLTNNDLILYKKHYKMISNVEYKYTLLILVKMIFNKKIVIKDEWYEKSRMIAKYIYNFYQNKKEFNYSVQKLTDGDFDYDFNPMIIEYLSLKSDLDKYNYINNVVCRFIVNSGDGSCTKFFLNQFSKLCYRHTKYKAFYEFYSEVKEMM